MTRVHLCHSSNQRYALACAYFPRCADRFARSRSDFVCDSRSGPGTGGELERSQHAPEQKCGRRDSWWQEKVAYFLGLQMRVLWWWVWVSGWHRLQLPTPQFHRYTLCRSHELQVHVIDPTRRFLHGKSSPTWHPRCVHVGFTTPCADFVLPVCHTHFVTPKLCHNVYKVNNVNNSVIMVHKGKQSVLFLWGNRWQIIFYSLLNHFIGFMQCVCYKWYKVCSVIKCIKVR
jgi:hypothetical protein